MDFPSFVMGQHHCYMVKDRVNTVQKALRSYGGSFVLVSKEDFDATPVHMRREFGSLPDFMSFLQQNYQIDKVRGYN